MYYYYDFHNCAESLLQAPTAKPRFGFHQSNSRNEVAILARIWCNTCLGEEGVNFGTSSSDVRNADWRGLAFEGKIQQIYEKLTNCTLQLTFIASIMGGWNVSVVKRAVKLVGIRWADITSDLSLGLRQYIVLARKNTSSALAGKIVPPNTTSSEIGALYGFTEYHITVVGINNDAVPFKSKDVLAITDEGSESIIFTL